MDAKTNAETRQDKKIVEAYRKHQGFFSSHIMGRMILAISSTTGAPTTMASTPRPISPLANVQITAKIPDARQSTRNRNAFPLHGGLVQHSCNCWFWRSLSNSASRMPINAASSPMASAPLSSAREVPASAGSSSIPLAMSVALAAPGRAGNDRDSHIGSAFSLGCRCIPADIRAVVSQVADGIESETSRLFFHP